MPSEKLIELAKLSQKITDLLKLSVSECTVFRSKGLLAHLLKRKHYTAAKYLDFLSDIIQKPDYAGFSAGTIELVKCFKDNIFISISLDVSKGIYYVSTMYDISSSKLEKYCTSGRLLKVD